MIVVDTGPLVAAAISTDADNHACNELLASLHLADREIVVPGLVIAEVTYLLQRRGGTRSESQFLRSFVEGDLSYMGLEPEDFVRMVELVETYADFPLGATGAAVIAVAERLGATEIATLDHRHFRAVRPRHVQAFTLLP
ncbi:MAG: type II toxin-antitoxin system VapC family toxin [Dermatophilaceae bacterium]